MVEICSVPYSGRVRMFVISPVFQGNSDSRLTLDNRSDRAKPSTRNLHMALGKGYRDIYRARSSVSMKMLPWDRQYLCKRLGWEV